MHIIISGLRNRQSGIDADIEVNFSDVPIFVYYLAHEIALISNIINSQRGSVFTFQRVLTVSIPLIPQTILFKGMSNHLERDASARRDLEFSGSPNCLQCKVIFNTYIDTRIICSSVGFFSHLTLIISQVRYSCLQGSVCLSIQRFSVFEPLIGKELSTICCIIININKGCQYNGPAVRYTIAGSALNVCRPIFINLNIEFRIERIPVSIADVAPVLSVLLCIERISIRAFDFIAVICPGISQAFRCSLGNNPKHCRITGIDIEFFLLSPGTA